VDDPLKSAEQHLSQIKADVRHFQIQGDFEVDDRRAFRTIVIKQLGDIRANTAFTFYAVFLCLCVLCLILWRVW
jgi:hypothetical protein